jgi:hypothetical protein
MCTVIDLLGGTAFLPVKKDLEGNVAVRESIFLQPIILYILFGHANQKVRARYNAASAKSATLEQLVMNEKTEKKHPATEGLMWLLRGLYFTCKSLQNSQANNAKGDDLSAAFLSGYGDSLKQFHNFFVKGVFGVCLCLLFLNIH